MHLSEMAWSGAGTGAGWASETDEQASGEGHVILKIASGFLIVIGLAGIEVTNLEPEANGDSEHVQDRPGVQASAKNKRSGVGALTKGWGVNGRGLTETGIAPTE